MNFRTKQIIEHVKAHPEHGNLAIASIFGCHANNISNIRRRYNLPACIRGNGTRHISLSNQVGKKLWMASWSLMADVMDNMRKTRKLTKYRFIAETMGYRGTSLTLDGYLKYIAIHAIDVRGVLLVV